MSHETWVWLIGYSMGFLMGVLWGFSVWGFSVWRRDRAPKEKV
jgi:hypothetical protein